MVAVPAEGQDLLNQVFGPFADPDDPFQFRPPGAVVEAMESDFRISDDGAEDIVEIMGDSPARVPMASIFWARKSCFSKASRSSSARFGALISTKLSTI
jgi:hypothetical protein